MESTTTNMSCPVCTAPLHKWEFTKHLKGCFAIVMPNMARPPVDTKSAAQIHYEDQQAAWRRNKASGHWVPGADPRSE